MRGNKTRPCTQKEFLQGRRWPDSCHRDEDHFPNYVCDVKPLKRSHDHLTCHCVDVTGVILRWNSDFVPLNKKYRTISRTTNYDTVSYYRMYKSCKPSRWIININYIQQRSKLLQLVSTPVRPTQFIVYFQLCCFFHLFITIEIVFDNVH